MNIYIIAAVGKNNVIGIDGKIPWKIPGEQSQFKELTTNNIVIMGRHSYEEIGKPLPNRITIVVSKTKTFTDENLFSARSLNEALEMASKYDKDVYIAGGSSLFKEALPLAKILYITKIYTSYNHYDGCKYSYFPIFDPMKYDKHCLLEENQNPDYCRFKFVRKNM